MGEESTSAAGSGPVNENSSPITIPSIEGGNTPGADATIDFRRDETRTDPDAQGRPVAPLLEHSFLDPPRDGDELGWLAHYRVRRPIGSGGMGLVFQAEDTHLLRPVALKVIRPELAASPEAAARFAREARTAAAIKHDNVVTIYQVGEAKGVAFLAMEYLQGLSLQRWLDRGKKPSIDLILRIGREIASGLVAAHRLGLVHRDIKPANIWLEAPNGRAKILDFGQARAEREDVQITRSGAIMGTPAFMSPEQAAGDPVTSSSDLFSLGCVLYRLCCGQLPFQGKTILSVLNALANYTPTPPLESRPDIPEGLNLLVMRLLAKSPDHRPACAQDVVDAIRTVERQLAAQRQAGEVPMGSTPQPIIAKPFKASPVEELPLVSPPQPGYVNPRPRRPRASVAFAFLAVALGLAVWFTRHPRFQRDFRPHFPPPPMTVTETPEFIPEAPPDMPRTPGPPPIEKAVRSLPPPVPPAEAGNRVKVAQETPHTAPPPDTVVAVDRPRPPPPPPAQRSPSASESPAPQTSEAVWGVFVDPGGDCRLLLDEIRHTATLEVPGRPHVLSAELQGLNAPRTLRPVSGNFQVNVYVLGTEKVAGRATTKEYPPYHGGGILVWQDSGNYVRLEIATDLHKGKPRHYANFEYRRNAQLVSSNGQSAEAGAAHLRLERKENEILASFSTDEARWVHFPVLRVSLAHDLQIGLVGINTATRPLSARFEGYRLNLPPKETEKSPR